MTKQSIKEDRHGRLKRPRDDNNPLQYQQGYIEFYKQSLKNSTKNIPKAYINGYIEFYKLRFKVTPDVLIPRPETELLVDEVLEFIKDSHVASAPRNDVIAIPTTNRKKQSFTILDIGTGSGNIAISIAKNLPNVKIFATDISQKALNVAKQNAKLHGVEKQITFLKSSLLSSQKLLPLIQNSKYQILVTNLPYIPTARISYLDSSVKDFEPWVALDGGKDGFELYRKLFQQIAKFSLPPLGWKPKLIIGEIDYTHGELALSEAQKYFPEAKIEVKLDLAHRQRILLIKQ